MNAIPIVGWMFSCLVSISISIPFWICWTWMEIGQTYFRFLPSAWHSIPFWDCVCLMIVIDILTTIFGGVLRPSMNKEETKK